MTPKDAARRIRAIRADKEHAYHDPRHPQHEDAMAVMRGLYEVAYPGSDRPFDDMRPAVDRARSAIRERQADADFMTAYLEPDQAGHAEAARTMRELYAAGYPERGAGDPDRDAG